MQVYGQIRPPRSFWLSGLEIRMTAQTAGLFINKGHHRFLLIHFEAFAGGRRWNLGDDFPGDHFFDGSGYLSASGLILDEKHVQRVQGLLRGRDFRKGIILVGWR